MFSASSDTMGGGGITKYKISRDSEQLTYASVLDLWVYDAGFRSFYIDVLLTSPFTVYRWETPPIKQRTANQPFEFVLVDVPEFAHTGDRLTFSDYFSENNARHGIVTFANLGKDAILVVPSPRGEDRAYRHLAAFTRNAPDVQKHALWETVGRTMLQHLSDRPVWLNTASGGVAWLHVRLDSRPKYYTYAPYASFGKKRRVAH